MLTLQDLQNIRMICREETVSKKDFQELRADLEEVKADMQNLKADVQSLQQQIDDIKDYMHRKFIWIENDLVMKVNILYETRDMYVQYTQYQKRNEEVDNQFAYIASLFKVVQSHGERLEYHEQMLNKLMIGS
ncbi:MAG: hypothetical protein K2K56_01885 [Lachnospiraceae bacterium]|nr:hypothetical protein [Lachnospiraceae bacterium]